MASEAELDESNQPETAEDEGEPETEANKADNNRNYWVGCGDEEFA